MKNKYKLLFYILSVFILGAVTIWEILAVRNELSLTSGKQPETEIDRVKEVIGIWETRKPFTVKESEQPTLRVPSPSWAIPSVATPSPTDT